jgi:membrane-associated protein
MDWMTWTQHWTDAEYIIRTGGLVLVLLLVFLETAVLLGIVLPGGDYVVFTAGLLCGTFLDVPLWLLLLLMWTAAVGGDLMGYYKGRWLGPKLFNKPENRVFKPEYLFRTRKIWIRYGVFAFIVGRFIPIVRTLLPMMAGATGLPLRKFAIYDIAGGLCWVGSLVAAGYFLGKQFPQIFDYMHFVLLIVIVISSFPLIRMMTGKDRK